MRVLGPLVLSTVRIEEYPVYPGQAHALQYLHRLSEILHNIILAPSHFRLPTWESAGSFEPLAGNDV
jgi:hypothetical protein